MKKTTVMIVDDHVLLQDTWSLLLASSEKYEVAGKAGNGEDAIKLAREKRPDIMLVDINMSPMNGFEVLQEVRKFSPGTKVIGVSMHSQPAYAKKMLREGAKGYITKNSNSEEFLFGINEVAEGRQYVCKEVKEILAEQVLGVTKPTGIETLSNRELEVIRYIRDGLTSKEIADILCIAAKTIEVHRHNILKKLGVKNSAGLIQLINNHGL
jgi:two-component system, NarL family, invasion response regulator UvrY